MTFKLGHYPLVERLLLFFVPMLFWLVARGVDGLATLARGRAAPVIAALLALSLWPMLSDGVAEARQPSVREDLRPVLARLAEQARPGDLILVWNLTHYAFDYYWPRLPHGEVAVQVLVFPPDRPLSPEKIAAQLRQLTAGHDHVWLVARSDDLGTDMENVRGLTAALRQEYPRMADFDPADPSVLGVVFSPSPASLPPSRPAGNP